jgi:ABC-2 type transport system ATP-binding protein
MEDDETLIVSGIPIEEIGERAFAAGIVLHELSTHAGSLEDLFLAWTSGEDETDDAQAEVTHL